MLDQETKRKIDNARDILVGKVPDPKSQVEQITIALIYKFMDDMDKDSEALGGKATFFTGEFEKYAWPKIVDTKLGGQERLNLYAEAITQLNHNRNIPQLFRDIFKNAFLPYRDPETLNMFLKEVNGFHYDHSENLGDAYEYLLAVLGSQGEAGQFRTPRHIIDFMVEVVEPKKNETGLDPACGTSGFLISFFNHILRENTKERKGDQLTPDERKRLMGNLTGYDISPDMVRISLVNMYLHGFASPLIHEYDTLTSEDRWQETADIILANPPFMSPKGGIRPHKRFSIKANRSEVLFVDYIAEHLSTNGRAGVIVPEGIIFQSANAYKALRKMLVDGGYLYAVVSLPAGVFNPYSGVKTSILFMDKVLAKRTQDILFVKVENDGFDLGAQRRPIDKDDLPRALEILLKYKRGLQEGKEVEFTEEEKQIAHVVPKAKIGEKGDYNLTGDRYKANDIHSHKDWPMIELCDVFEKVSDSVDPSSRTGDVRFIGLENITSGTGDLTGNTSTEISDIKSTKIVFKKGDILYGKLRPNLNKVWHAEFEGICSTDILALRAKRDDVSTKLFSYLFRSGHFNTQVLQGLSGSQLPRVNFSYMASLEIPLPPMEVQQEIVAEIEGYQKIIDGAKQIVENWKPQIKIDEAWPVVELGEICEIIMGQSPDGRNYNISGDGVPLINGPVEFGAEMLSKTIKAKYTTQITKMCKTDDLILCVRGSTTGRTNIAGFDACIGRGVAALRARQFQPWVNHYIVSIRDKIYGLGSGSTFPNITLETLAALEVPLPPFEIQRQIVAQIEEEQKIVDATKRLIEIYEDKIEAKIAEVWGE